MLVLSRSLAQPGDECSDCSHTRPEKSDSRCQKAHRSQASESCKDVGARVVLASGEVVDTDDEGHTELLWALRGAGNGNVGIVTQLRVKTYPYPGFLAGILAFPLAEAKEVLRQFHELVAATPTGLHDAMVGESMIFFPPAAIPLFAFQFVWAADKDGSFDDGQTWLDKMRSLGTLALDFVVEREPSSPFNKLRYLHRCYASMPLGPFLYFKLVMAS
jgi:hypothetical protein